MYNKHNYCQSEGHIIMKYIFLLLVTFNASSKNFFDAWSDWNASNRAAIVQVFIPQKTVSENDSFDESAFPQDPKRLTFNDYIGGVPKELEIVKDTYTKGKNSKFKKPKGILLEGLPGTGKTYVVKCLAGELNATIIEVNAADLMDMWVGSGPSKIKQYFEQARATATPGKPTIIFFDEFDSIGSRAGKDEFNSAVTEEKKKTINALLAQMDGFNKDDNIVVIAATNRADDIDDAFKRPGRFDYICKVELPDGQKRLEILNYYITLYACTLDTGVDMAWVADQADGFNCADLRQIVVDAQANAVFREAAMLNQEDFVKATKKRFEATGMAKTNRSRLKTEAEKVTFNNIVGGVPQVIEDLKKHLEDDEYFKALGIKPPSGILFVGPPGTGKTLLAKAIAGEVDAAFFAASASSFIQIFVGTGPKAVRELFDQARVAVQNGHAKKAIIFIDEIDSIGSRSSHTGNSGEDNKTINELLVQMDGFDKDGSILVIGATNRAELLDEALLRPGRFDFIVDIPLPDLQKRADILIHYLTNFPRELNNDIDIVKLAQQTKGFNCAELADVVNKALLNAAHAKRKIVMMNDLELAYKEIAEKKKRF